MLDVPPEEFEELVARALDQVPVELADLMDNVVIQIFDDSAPGSPLLLGLYEGIPLTERGASYFAALPDRISIFRKPILSICQDLPEVVEQVRITVIHEIAHHFGIDDERLHDLGYG